MAEEKTVKVYSWVGTIGSAVVIILSGFILIGSYKTDVDTLKKVTEKIDVQNQVQEQRITKLEMCYDNLRETLNEMKVDIKDIKKMTQDRVKGY